MKQIDVIGYMEQIAKRSDFKFCDHEDERNGITPKICVYKDVGFYDFVGCIRFADENGKYDLSIDPSVIYALEGKEVINK